ncbi:hypothetical protein BDW66DRAFT_146308 [Aspergillus desertorum]
MRSKRTWYVLKDSIPADKATRLLGAIVQDFRDPLACYTPREAIPAEIVPAIGASVITVDTDAKTEVASVRATTFSTQLLETLSGCLGQTRADHLTLEAASIQTWKMENHAQIFEELIAHSGVRADLDGRLRSGKVFFIVGLKLCSSARFSRVDGKFKERSLGVQVPLDAAIGLPGMLPNLTVGQSAAVSGQVTTRYSGLADGDRIFAIEYRVARTDWFGYGSHTTLGRKVDAKDGGRFFSEHDEDEEASEDEDYDGVEDEQLRLVDEAYTATCLKEDGAEVDAESEYVFR